MSERVLCMKRDTIPDTILQKTAALKMSWGNTDTLFKNIPFYFMSRNMAEGDTRNKQIIPYVLIQNEQGEILTYHRIGSEKRLLGYRSIGLGGHINDLDSENINVGNLYELLKAGIKRELNEEVNIENGDQADFLGLINEEISRVGEVHLGFVFVYYLPSTEEILQGEELGQITWMNIDEIQMLIDEFELWSKLAIELLK